MKSMYMNCFKDGKLYQWDESKEVFLVQKILPSVAKITPYESEFCLDKASMDTFLKFECPEVKVGKVISIKSGNIKGNLKPIEQQFFFPDFDNVFASFEIDIDKLKVATKFVAVNNNSRPILTGIHFEKNNAYATDTNTLYRAEIKSEDGGVNLTITSAFIDVLKTQKGNITIRYNNNVAIYDDDDGTTYIGRVFKALYPNVENIFNNFTGIHTARFNTEEMRKYLSLLNNGYIVFSDRNIKLVESPNDEVYNLSVDIDTEFNDFYCLSIQKFRNVVNSITDDTITMQYTDRNKLCMINDNFILCPVTYQK